MFGSGRFDLAWLMATIRCGLKGLGGFAVSLSNASFLSYSAYWASLSAFFFSAKSANLALFRSIMLLSLYFLYCICDPFIDPESEFFREVRDDPKASLGLAVVSILICPDYSSLFATEVAPENSIISFFVTFY